MTVDVSKVLEPELIFDQNESLYAFDLDKIPGTGDDSYFILHSTYGLYLIDPMNKKSYILRYDDNSNANTCRSVAVVQIDDEDEERGFWLANIDSSSFPPEIKVFDFDNKFITELRKISQQVNAGGNE